MSESKSSNAVGNLRNRIDKNLKLSIPKPNCSIIKNQPSTAPCGAPKKTPFSDLPVYQLMKNWDLGGDAMNNDDDYFVSTPGSATSSSLKRKSTRNSGRIWHKTILLLSDPHQNIRR